MMTGLTLRRWLAPAGLFAIVLLCGCGGPARDATAADPSTEPSTTQTAPAASDETAVALANEAAAVEGASNDADAGEPDRKGEDWPHFLGLRGTGVSGETEVLKTWPEGGPKIAWEKTVGTGYSAPSVRGNRLVVHHRIGSKEIIECVRADNGKALWKHSYRSDYSDPYGYNNGPRCSPLLTADRCYTYGAEGKLVCLDLKTGEKVWMRDAKTEWKLPDWFFGIGCSPILEGDMLIVLVGGQPDSGVVAFNKETGATVWEAVGKKTWDGAETERRGGRRYKWTGDEQIVSYSSPVVVTIHGKRHLLVLGRQGLVSLDPATGAEHFHYWFRATVNESVNAARPIVVGDEIFLTAAYEVGSALLKVKPSGAEYDVVWRNTDNMLCHWSTPIAVDGYVYGFSGRHERDGELRCVELKTGDVVWSTTGFDGQLKDLEPAAAPGMVKDARTGKTIPIPFYGRGSKIQIGDRFLVLGERGKLALVKVDHEKWEELGATSYDQISVPVWTAPVLSRGRVYLRDEDSLICLDVPPKE